MNRNTSIRLKAASLVIVFSLNTVVGFACAMCVNMGFNTTHHHDHETDEVTVAAGTKKHHHDSKETAEKGGCCNDKVINFQNLDKNLIQNTNTVINAPVFIVNLSSFYGIDIFKPAQVSAQKYIDLFFHPPPPDIRVLIRSFQI